MPQNFKSPSHYLAEVLESYHRKHLSHLVEKYQSQMKEVREFLVKEFKEHLAGDPFLSGSYTKKTDVNLKFDLDLVLPFAHKALGDHEATAKAVHKALQKRYPGVSIRMQPSSVRLRFQESVRGKIEEIDLDIVPGMECSKGDFQATRNLQLSRRDHADDLPRIIQTNVEKQIAHVKASEHGNARKVIQLLKVWKKRNNLKVGSFVLELVTIEAFRRKDLESRANLFEMLAGTMEFMAEEIEKINLRDPGNNSNNVAQSIPSQIRIDLANRMKNRAKELRSSPEKTLQKLFPIHENP